MTIFVANRVQQTSTSTGLGPFQPTGSVSGFSSWGNSIPANTDDIPYLIEAVNPSTNTPSGEWETGLGLWSGSTLIRSTVTGSSNGGAPVDFSAGTKLMSLTVNSSVLNSKANSADVNAAIASVDNGATVKAQAAQDFAIQRANHTGTQLSTTISDFPAAARAQVAAQIVQGDNVTITPAGSGAGQTLTISSTIPTGDRGDINVTNGGLTWTVEAGAINTTKLGGDITPAGKALLDDASNVAQRATLGLVIGTDVQAQDAQLQALAGLVPVADRLPYFTGETTAALTPITAAARNFLDDTNQVEQRATLGLGTLATQDGTFSGTSSGTNTGDQNIFSTIAVAGQSNVVADTTSDTLTLVAGSNITLTTNASTDSITIAASGGGGSSVYYNLVTDGGLVPGGATDNTAAFVAAAAAAAAQGRPMWLPDGEYRLNDAVIQLSSTIDQFELYGTGTFVYDVGDGAFTVVGEWGPEIPITSFTPISAPIVNNPNQPGDITPTFTTVGVGSVASLSRQDIVKLYCNTRYTYTDLNGDSPFVAETHPILSVNSGANTFRIPLFFERDLFNGATTRALRKMIPRRVVIEGISIRSRANIYVAPFSGRKRAITLIGLVRPRVNNVTIISASQIGICDESSYMGDFNVRFIELFNGSEVSVFGYGYQARYGCTGSRYSYIGSNGRHLFTTDFEDQAEPFAADNWYKHGGCFNLTIENGVSYCASGVAFDTHEFCYYPTFRNCAVYRSYNLLDEGDGVACFSHRSYSPTYFNCIAVGGTNGFQDTSAQYAFGHTAISTSAPLVSEAGVARYINCVAIGQSSGQGFTLGAAAAAFATPQAAQTILMQGCQAHGCNYGFQTNAATTLIMDGCSATACISGPGRWISGAAGTMNHVFRNCTFDYTGLTSTATGWRNSSATVTLNVDVDGLVVRGSASRPATAAFEIGSTPAGLNFEARGVRFFDRSAPIRIIATTGAGTIPAGSRIYIPDGGAGPEVAYGTQVSVGDASTGTIVNNSSPPMFIWDNDVSAVRTATLTATNARKDDTYTFVRTRNSGGAGSVVVSGTGNASCGFNDITLVAGGPGVTVKFDGARWQRIS